MVLGVAFKRCFDFFSLFDCALFKFSFLSQMTSKGKKTEVSAANVTLCIISPLQVLTSFISVPQ